jgi:hypothetical protein
MNTATAPQEGTMERIWVVTAKEFGGAEEIVHDGHRLLVFADTAEGYSGALGAFTAVVRDRIGPAFTTFEYGQFGTDARTQIIVRDSREDHDDCCSGGYTGDTYQLQPYEVQAG